MDHKLAAVLADLARQGRIRVAINCGNPVLAHPHPDTGQPQGVSVDLARKLGSTLGVPVEHVTFDATGKVFEALKTAAWDVAFLAVDPVRAEQIAFTAPYVVIEGSYIVRDGSTSCRSVQVPGFDGMGRLTPPRRLYPLPVRQASVAFGFLQTGTPPACGAARPAGRWSRWGPSPAAGWTRSRSRRSCKSNLTDTLPSGLGACLGPAAASGIVSERT